MEELICPNCKIPLVEKRGTSLKTHKPYHFWGCPNYPDCDYVYHEGIKPAPKERVEEFSPPERKEVSALTLDDWKKIEGYFGIIRGDIKTLKKEFNIRMEAVQEFMAELEKKSAIYPKAKQPTE